MEFTPDVKENLRNLFDDTLIKICNKHRQRYRPEKIQLSRQKEIREELNHILNRVDIFLEEEKIDLRSEEFLILLFDKFYKQLKDRGVFNFV
ncbi:MAG: hypothetical protein ACTSU5_01430 [Promethearchaeota archaeon]